MSSLATRRWVLLIVLAAISALIAGIAPASAATTYIDESFESATWDRARPPWHNWLSGGYISKSQVAGIDGNGTRITMVPGSHDAAMLNYQFAANGHADPSEAYFRYWLRFDDLPEDTGKLPGFMALYSDSARGNVRPTESQPGWSARVLYGPGSNGQSVKLGYYLYWLNQATTVGDKLWWTQEIPLGDWVCVEGRVSMNTPGNPDGQLQAWLGGSEVFNRTDVLYRTASQANVKIRDFMFEVLYGGSSTPPRNTSVSFDSLTVTDQRIGCDTPPTSRFTDTAGSPFVAEIEWLADQGITRGCNPSANTRYCPNSAVTRGQMAAFLRRALGGILTVPALPPEPDDPPRMWGAAVALYKEALANMPGHGHPLDTIVVTHNLAEVGWFGTNIGDVGVWAPLQMSNIDTGGAVPYVLLSMPDIAAFSNGGADPAFTRWLSLMSTWLDQDTSRRLLIAPFPNANNRNSVYGDDAASFIGAYRRVHDAIRNAGYDGSRVRFVYQMSAQMKTHHYPASVGSGFGLYSPGPEYVDLAAVWWLNYGNTSWDDWDSVYLPRVTEMQSHLGTDVPIVLTMVGTVDGAGADTRSAWFDSLAAGIASSKSVVGFQYFDWNRGTDFRVDTDTQPDAAMLRALDTMAPPHDQLNWVFSEMDAWKEEMRASSLSDLFSDDNGSVFESDIGWLSRSGITRGCGPRLFCPGSAVTRGQMAAFLHRALGHILTPSLPAPSFVDVSNSTFKSDIVWLAKTGVTRGCAVDRFCPDAPVTRGQMAAFLHRALRNLLP